MGEVDGQMLMTSCGIKWRDRRALQKVYHNDVWSIKVVIMSLDLYILVIF